MPLIEITVYLVTIAALLAGIWMFIAWSRFTRQVRKEHMVTNEMVRRTLIHVASASLAEGFMIWVIGVLVSSSAPLENWREYGISLPLSLLGCMGGFLILGIISFLLRVVSFKAMYKKEQ